MKRILALGATLIGDPPVEAAVKKRLILPTILIATTLATSSASAVGLTLNWGGCFGSGAQSDQVFDCSDAGALYNLVLNLQPPAYTNWFAVDNDISLQTADPTNPVVLPAFWRMDSNGCNATGLSISANRNTIPNVGCSETFTTGALVYSEITGYGSGFDGPNRAIILISVGRSASSPINAVAGTNYYLSHLTFATEHASESGGSCDGCRSPVAMVWNSATLFSVTNSNIQINDPGLGSNCATVNGGASMCAATPTRNRTWGEIKSLYR